MIELWIPVTIAAGFFQNLRSVVQKQLKGRLSNQGAAYSRFFYAFPVALAYLLVLQLVWDLPLPRSNPVFLLFCLVGGIFQILFTVFLLWMFSFQSFAVGTTFSKLEVVWVAILAAVVLGENLSAVAVLAIGLSAVGVVALSLGQNNLTIKALFDGVFSKATFMGIACAGCLGASSMCYRGAALALDHQPFYIAAAFALVIALAIQTILMGAYLMIREPGEMTRLIKNWKFAGLAGLAGAAATACWFTAFALQKASYVRAVGQTELIFTFIATTVYFREKVNPAEYLGIFLVLSGIILLLLYG